MATLLLMLVHPYAVAERIRQRPSWLMAATCLSFISVAMMIIMRSHVFEMTMSHLPSSATNDDKRMLTSLFDQRLGAELAFLPIRLLAGWVCTALVIFFLQTMWSSHDRMQFQQIFSLEIHAEVFTIVGRIAAGFALLFSTHDLKVILSIPLGLDSILPPSENIITSMFLNSINIFSLGYICVLGIGLSVFGKLHTAKGCITSLLAWSLTTTLNIAVIALLREKLHLTI